MKDRLMADVVDKEFSQLIYDELAKKMLITKINQKKQCHYFTKLSSWRTNDDS